MTTTKADPKPGRWILPLVIIGMVIFTYVFVGNIRDNTQPTDIDISLGSGSTDTTQPDSTGSTPSTTQPIGVVVDAVLSAYGWAELLAVVKVSAAEATLSVGGQSLVAKDLPYDLPSMQDDQADAG